MATYTYDIENTASVTSLHGPTETYPAEARVVRRRGVSGRFSTLRQAQAFLKGMLLYRGRYYTRAEIAEKFIGSKEWAGAQVERTSTGWHFKLGAAELWLRAA